MLVKVITKVGFIVRFDLEERQVFCFFCFQDKHNSNARNGEFSALPYNNRVVTVIHNILKFIYSDKDYYI